MAKTQPKYETEDQYNLRLELRAQVDNLKMLTMKDGGWSEIIQFFGRRIAQAKAEGNDGVAAIVADLNNEFVRGYFQYVALSYKESLARNTGGILSPTKSKRQIEKLEAEIEKLTALLPEGLILS